MRAARLYEQALAWRPLAGITGARLQVKLGEALAKMPPVQRERVQEVARLRP